MNEAFTSSSERGIFIRSTSREDGPDKTIIEMFEKRAGQDERKTMELVSTRKK